MQKSQCWLNGIILCYGFTKIFYMPDEATEIIAASKECLIKSGARTTAFIPDELRSGILKDILTEDYLAPQQVILI